MALHDPNQPIPSDPSIDTDADSRCEVDSNRRKFTGAGLGVSAIFTLASQPVLAGACKSPSGAESGNLSQHGPLVTCTGLKPASWVVAPYDKEKLLDTKFHSVFGKVGGVDYGKANMKEVMKDCSTSRPPKKPQGLCAEFAAAWMNIKTNRIPASVLTDTRLITMWNELLQNKQYVPMAGATPWLPVEVVKYLQSLQSA